MNFKIHPDAFRPPVRKRVNPGPWLTVLAIVAIIIGATALVLPMEGTVSEGFGISVTP